MSETKPNLKPFSPTDMARIAMRNRPNSSVTELKVGTLTPHESGIYEENGRKYRFVPITYTSHIRDVASPGGFRTIEHPYTLRDWFSHTFVTPEGDHINGPGWDSRLRLSNLTQDEMMRRYGHTFTLEEIDNPSGEEDWETGKRAGGMPDNISYYELEPIDK